MYRYLAAAVLFAAVFMTTYCCVVIHQLEDRIDLEAALDAPVVASQIYARPLQLEPGLWIERDVLYDHLHRLRYRWVSAAAPGAGEFGENGQTIVIGQRPPARSSASAPEGGPSARLVVHFARGAGKHRAQRIERITDTQGKAVDRIYLPAESLAHVYGDRWIDRKPTALGEVPRHLIDAVLAVEDRRFFEHRGLDFYRAAGALVSNLRSGRVVEGGSSLTQQLVKNLYLRWERALGRKVLEAIIAVALEYRLSKEQILEAYLNEAYLGQRGPASVRGVGAAALHYFGKDVGELDLGESALLAGLIQAPGRYAPFRTPRVAKARRDQVLGMMLSTGLIARHAYVRAIEKPLTLVAPPSHDMAAPYFVDYVRKELAPIYSRAKLERSGLAIMTTLDPRLQRLATRAVGQGLDKLEADYGSMRRERSPLQAALVALDPATGDILAMVGGRDYRRSQFNRAADAYRHPGSAFKPFVALTALSRRGDAPPAYTLTTLVDDAPLAVADAGGTWRPQNYDRKFRGLVTVRTALEQSLNVPMARIGLDVGPERVATTARLLGITSRLEPYPSIVLGASELSLLEMTRAYATLAGGGLRPEVRSIRAVRDGNDADGVGFETKAPWLRRVFAPDEVYLVTSALQGVVARGTGAPVRSLGYRGPLAAKTGTSDDYRDAWFMGYTPELVVGVRVGYDDDASVGLTARVVALPIFAEFIISALGPEGKSGFVVPGSMEQVDVLDLPGLSPGSAWKGEQELFLAGTAPQGVGRGATADARGRSDASDAQARAVTRAPSDVDAHEARSQAWSPFGWSEDGPAAARRRDNRRRIGGMRPGSHQALAVR